LNLKQPKNSIFNLPDVLYTLDERTWIIDAEADALENYTALWVVVLRNWLTDEVVVFRNLHLDATDFNTFCKNNVSWFCGHNVIKFDKDLLRKFTEVDLTPDNTIDTLVVSRLMNTKRVGGHSVEAWGATLGHGKDTFNDFSRYSKELEDRCIKDTLIQKEILKKFEKHLLTKRWKLPIYLENTIEFYNLSIKHYGFYYDYEKHLKLLEELKSKLDVFKTEFEEAFGVDFNPASPKQRIDVLHAAGWKPVEKTKGHIAELRKKKQANKEKLERYKVYGYTTNEVNLNTLPDTAPVAAKKLVEFLMLNSRLGDLEEWGRAYNPLDGAIHPTITGLGGWTHRRSHQAPNSANIPALINRRGQPQPYGKEMRGLWQARPKKVLVGTDAAGIQLRIFCHYTNDQRLIEAVVKGKKEDGTDIHTVNKNILGSVCKGREPAKTYIYAKFLGASLPKIAEILGCTIHEADQADKRIMQFYPGWQKLKEKRIPADANRGYFEGLDGRYVFVPSEHHVLAGYLQNGESIIMKMANIKWMTDPSIAHIDFHQVNDVHDEWQTEVPDELGYPDLIGKTQVAAIEYVGGFLGLNCPLTGEYKIGHNWAETH